MIKFYETRSVVGGASEIYTIQRHNQKISSFSCNKLLAINQGCMRFLYYRFITFYSRMWQKMQKHIFQGLQKTIITWGNAENRGWSQCTLKIFLMNNSWWKDIFDYFGKRINICQILHYRNVWYIKQHCNKKGIWTIEYFHITQDKRYMLIV